MPQIGAALDMPKAQQLSKRELSPPEVPRPNPFLSSASMVRSPYSHVISTPDHHGLQC